ncbi:MAG: DUF6288 domain-containing protein [Planctomycetota bacterium]|jgi:hypothetical protein
MRIRIFAALFLATSLSFALSKNIEKVYERTTNVGPDKEVGGWFINFGRTGARAKLLPAEPTKLVIAYVFPRTPASKALAVGDRIVGVNGKRFATPHKFGYGMDVFGYDGPLKDLGEAMEQGPITVTVERGQTTFEARLKLSAKDAAFSKTYPFDCPKSARILKASLRYLAERQKPNGTWHNRPHINTFATLALMASGDKRYRPHVKKSVQAMAADTMAVDKRGRYNGWHYGFAGIVLGEYYLQTKQKWVRKELQEIHDWLKDAQAPQGGWGHRAWGLAQGNGYGPFCMVTAQVMMALSLMEQGGIAVDPEMVQRTHEFLKRGTNEIGYVWYADKVAKPKGYADMGRTGASALGHVLSSSGGVPYYRLGLRSAQCIGKYPSTFPDTHGSPLLGQAWVALAAAIDPPSFRKLMDEYRWFWNLSRTGEGEFIYQPNRDNNPQDYTAAPRLSATAMTALVFSIQSGKLKMMNPVGR